MIRVWDWPVRALHWALAASVGLAWITTEWLVRWHQTIGWAALAVVGARLLWGFIGNRHARFAQFVRCPRDTLRYARLALHGREPRYVGHNPLGACMALALWLCVAALALTGWLYTTDRLWGDATVGRVHLVLAWTLLALAALHVVGVVLASVRHRDNLVGAMTHGDKRQAEGTDID